MAILYKYMPSDRALLCLPEVGDGTLRATQPAALNDPFEGAVKAEYLEFDEATENRDLARVLTIINETTPIDEGYVSEARKKYGTLYVRELAAEQISRRLGIVSFSEDPRNPLLWAHYTTNGSGFVVGYDKEMIASLSSGEDPLRPVTYVDRLPVVLSPTDLTPLAGRLSALLSTKSSHWDHEKEWRLIVELSETIGTGQTDSLGQPINLIRVPNKAVMSVHCTERTPPDAVKEIRSRLADPNNRYQAQRPQKLVLSRSVYGYEDAPE